MNNNRIKIVDEDGVELKKGIHSPQYEMTCKDCGGIFPGSKRSVRCFPCHQENIRVRSNKRKRKEIEKRKCVVCGVKLGLYKTMYCSAKCRKEYAGR